MLKVDADGPVLRLTLARPEVRNALNEALIHALLDEFSNLSNAIRVVVLSGEGSAFCAGADLEWMRKGWLASEEENYHDALQTARLFHAVAHCPAAVVARVNGPCFGGGCGLLAASDIGVISASAKLCFSEVRLGLVPATIGPFVMNKIGRGNARALFVTGEIFDAHRACQMGLAHEVTEPTELDQAVQAKVDLLLNASPHAVSVIKSMTQDPLMGLEESARMLASIRTGPEAKEGMDAFLSKRKPTYAAGHA